MGLFRDRDSAQQAYNTLRARSYADADINVLMTDQTRKSWYPANHADTELGRKAGTKAMAGASVGEAIGPAVGALAAVIATTAVIALPGVGLVAAGPLTAALAGAGAGALTGGLIGALGIPEGRARLYDEGLKRGGMVMGVTPRSDDDAGYFEREWRNSRGEHIYRKQPCNTTSSPKAAQTASIGCSFGIARRMGWTGWCCYGSSDADAIRQWEQFNVGGAWYPSAMDAARQSVPEAGAYRTVQVAVADLRKAERALMVVEQFAPDPERAGHLVAIRAALAQLETFVQPLSL